MPRNILLEVCVDSVQSARAAQQGGAHRIELCDNLEEGGTTPNATLIEATRKKTSINLHVMIRVRPQQKTNEIVFGSKAGVDEEKVVQLLRACEI